MSILKKYILFILILVYASSYANTNESYKISSFAGIKDLSLFMGEDDYKEIIRASILTNQSLNILTLFLLKKISTLNLLEEIDFLQYQVILLMMKV